jgi:hypothetical protein
MKSGDRVRVYDDPFACTGATEDGVIKGRPIRIGAEGDTDIHGRALYDAEVKFPDSPMRYRRIVSEVLS